MAYAHVGYKIRFFLHEVNQETPDGGNSCLRLTEIIRILISIGKRFAGLHLHACISSDNETAGMRERVETVKTGHCRGD